MIAFSLQLSERAATKYASKILPIGDNHTNVMTNVINNTRTHLLFINQLN